MEESPWKKIKLSLERPYKDDNGVSIPQLFDITSDGEHIYESQDNFSIKTKKNLNRIFIERGLDFFEKSEEQRSHLAFSSQQDAEDNPDIDKQAERNENAIMNVEELFKMRMEILPQLFIALGEMSHAKELLTALLSTSPPPPVEAEPSSTFLSSTLVTKPPAIVSVPAFNSQLVIGSKDEALRKAANLFASAAESMETGRIKGEKYWIDALKIRKGNWGLTPAPLPFGSVTGKGSDKTSKDFIISYGLEESPAVFRRRAVGYISTLTSSNALVFPLRQQTRLQISLTIINESGVAVVSCNTKQEVAETTLDGTIKNAQKEVVEQEIFSLLVSEASNLPTASARVSERLVVIEAALGVELRFELVEDASVTNSSNDFETGMCDLIYNSLHVLLLCRHDRAKQQRLNNTGALRYGPIDDLPFMLQPIIDLLQYQVFCRRIRVEIHKIVYALSTAGISSSISIDPVGETGYELINALSQSGSQIIGGVALLRIDNWHSIRLTFLSPSLLTAHLSQATLVVSSVPQLSQLLLDEVEACLLQRICELGQQLCSDIGGTWFTDLNRCVARWEGCVLNFRVFFNQTYSIDCSVYRVDSSTNRKGDLLVYSHHHPKLPLISWVENMIGKSLLPTLKTTDRFAKSKQ